MEPSLTALRPPALIFAGPGVGQMPSSLSKFAIALGLTAPAGAKARPHLQDPPARRPPDDAWHSYAVYSGALSLRHF